MKKFTKRESLTAISNVLNELLGAEGNVVLANVKDKEFTVENALEFCSNEIALLDKKNGTVKKPTDKQMQNETYKEAILNYLREVTPEHKAIAEIWDSVEILASNPDMTGQRISALLTQLKNENKIVRVEEKRKAYFKAV